MPRTKSAMKQLKKSLKRRMRNKSVKSACKTAIKRVFEAMERKDVESAKEALRHAVSLLDKAASKSVIHKNTASRKQSRLMKKFNQFLASIGSESSQSA